VAQSPQFLDQQLPRFIAGLERPGGTVRQIEKALQAGQHRRLLPELLDEVGSWAGNLGLRVEGVNPTLLGQVAKFEDFIL
jgi:hypothetical protein